MGVEGKMTTVTGLTAVAVGMTPIHNLTTPMGHGVQAHATDLLAAGTSHTPSVT